MKRNVDHRYSCFLYGPDEDKLESYADSLLIKTGGDAIARIVKEYLLNYTSMKKETEQIAEFSRLSKPLNTYPPEEIIDDNFEPNKVNTMKFSFEELEAAMSIPEKRLLPRKTLTIDNEKRLESAFLLYRYFERTENKQECDFIHPWIEILADGRDLIKNKPNILKDKFNTYLSAARDMDKTLDGETFEEWKNKFFQNN